MLVYVRETLAFGWNDRWRTTLGRNSLHDPISTVVRDGVNTVSTGGLHTVSTGMG